MLNEIKKHLMYYGGTYSWVKNDLHNLACEAEQMIKNGETKHAEHAAFRVIDKRF